MSKFSDDNRSNRREKKNKLYAQSFTIEGFSNFGDESLPDYSEFDSDSVKLDYLKER